VTASVQPDAVSARASAPEKRVRDGDWLDCGDERTRGADAREHDVAQLVRRAPITKPLQVRTDDCQRCRDLGSDIWHFSGRDPRNGRACQLRHRA
jgi:hypothetical protein